MEYLDFDLEIGLGSGREYPITARTPAGEAQTTFLFPFDTLALDNRLKDLQIALLSSVDTRRQILTPQEETVQRFGKELFDLLIAGEVRNRYDVSREQARQQNKGLRLKLSIQSPTLAALPWEFLYDPRSGDYVCLSLDTPIVRYLQLEQPIAPLAVTPPLRILGMVVSPSDLVTLDVQVEKQRVERAVSALQQNRQVELTWLNGQTWRELRNAMFNGPWHIFHFVGHGGFDERRDEGLIALADTDGRARYFTATEFSHLLADHRSLRLVLLNVCEGARGSTKDVFSSTAATLVRRGIPAVVSMQYPITDKAAIEFSQTFYERLVGGQAVDVAVAEARKAILFEFRNTLEWGVPVLYLRSTNGQLFDVARVTESKPPVKAPTQAELPKGERTPESKQRQEDSLDADLTKQEQGSEPKRAEETSVQPSRQEQAKVTEVKPPEKFQMQPAYGRRWKPISISLFLLMIVAGTIYFWPRSSVPVELPPTEVANSAASQLAAIVDETATSTHSPTITLTDTPAPLTATPQMEAILESAAVLTTTASVPTVTPVPQPTNTPIPPSPTNTWTFTPRPTNTPVPPTLTATWTNTSVPPASTATVVTSVKIITLPPQPTSPLALPPPTNALIAQAGATRINPKDEAVYVWIPAGKFMMGSSDDDGRASGNEKPPHPVEVDGFWIMRTEVTNAQYKRCVDVKVCTEPGGDRWKDAQYTDHPVTFVDWNQVQSYAEWVGGRLPTEAEWEYACRGTDGRIYPWGNEEPNAGLVNYFGLSSAVSTLFELVTGVTIGTGSSSVGSYPPWANGLYDMAGNVAEWTSDWYGYDVNYYANSPVSNPKGPSSGSFHVKRGGSWGDTDNSVRCASRGYRESNDRLGFRVVSLVPTTAFTNTPVPLALPSPTNALIAQAGATRINPKDEAVYVWIPAGKFMMGSSDDDGHASGNEKPPHPVEVDGFWIMRTEVTNAQYKRCVDANVCTKPGGDRWKDTQYTDHPVTFVDWNQVQSYAEWVGGRLPTEAEWEYACRGMDGRIYPWVDYDIGDWALNYNRYDGDTMPVGSYPPGANGLYDMAGNVAEWTSDWYDYDVNYYANSPVSNPKGPSSGSYHVVRGGSWSDYEFDVRCAFRNVDLPDGGYDDPGYRDVGFRVVSTGF